MTAISLTGASVEAEEGTMISGIFMASAHNFAVSKVFPPPTPTKTQPFCSLAMAPILPISSSQHSPWNFIEVNSPPS